MNKATILTTDRAGLADPLLQTAAAVLGPAQVLFLDAPALWKSPLEKLLIYTRTADEAEVVAQLLTRNQSMLRNARIGWMMALPAAQKPGDASETRSQTFLDVVSYLALQDELDAKEKKQAVIEFTLRLRDWWREAALVGRANPEEVKLQVEDFLARHNTCTLATVYEGQVSSRAIEYRYAEGALYMVSEGGEKFAGLLSNGRAAVSIYESYQGFERLAGLQLTGWAEIPLADRPEYAQAVERFGLKLERIRVLPAHLHALVIHLEKAVYLWSGFTRLGYDARQEYTFKS
jgi:hypothetical protein